MPNVHDPYLDTVRRSLNNDKIKSRKNKIEKINESQKGFLSKKIILSDYIYLPEELQNLFLLAIFITIPYSFGVFILLIVIGVEKFKAFIQFNFDIFMLIWTVGYESIAFLLLLAIIKSALTFQVKKD
jgi:hypothetical protein